MNKTTFKYALFLVAICAIAGLLLALVNKVTAPVIEERSRQKSLPEKLEEYYPYEYYLQGDDGSNDVAENAVQAFYYAFNENKELEAVIFQTSFYGYKSQIISLISIKVDGTIEGARMIAGNDTYDLSDFDFEVDEETVDDYEYTIKAGMTKTSEGVVNGIDAAVSYFKSIKDDLGGVSYE
jgi:Na+-translocating ferredoxin:NAD+ oxidoreductase RnfG subunit